MLIVDDEPAIRQTMADILDYHGFDTATAANGREAWNYLQDHEPPCAILLDLKMPVMGGVEFFEMLHADPAHRDIPVIISSSSTELQHLPVFEEAVAFVPKPADPRELVRLIDELCLQ